MSLTKLEECSSYETCSAPLCPLDPQIKDRIWFVDEDICQGRAGSGKRWIKKQRSVQKRKPKSYCDKPISYQMLYDNSRPREMTDEQRAELKERGRKLAQVRKNGQTKANVTMAVGVN